MKANAVGKMSVEASRAYLAGLIDGDGCIMATIERHSEKKFGFRIRVQVKITQKGRGLLAELAREYRVGKVRQNRTTFDWVIRMKSEVASILDAIYPYTREKSEQVLLARQILNLSDSTRLGLMKMARLADALSKFNVRSKERRRNYAIMIKTPISPND